MPPSKLFYPLFYRHRQSLLTALLYGQYVVAMYTGARHVSVVGTSGSFAVLVLVSSTHLRAPLCVPRAVVVVSTLLDAENKADYVQEIAEVWI